MKRTNIFKLRPTRTQEQKLFELASNCSRLWNEVNYRRRQSFFNGNFDWNTDEGYNKYKKLVGSATAQQIIRKNNEAWKSFFALRRKKHQGKLLPSIRKVSPPRYWKNRRTSKRVLRILIRNDSYRLEGKWLKLPFGLKVRWSGKNKWHGKQGRLEIIYDDLSESWYAYQPVEIDAQSQSLHQSIGNKKAYCDLGVVNLIASWIEGDKQVIIYSGKPLLADWWYWTNKIAWYQSALMCMNNKRTSRRLQKLYQKRKRRFRHAVNTIVNRFIADAWRKGVSEIVMGDLRGIRENNRKSKKTDAMIHNFWSHNYLIQRIKEKAEEYGIAVTLINEAYTSSICPRCGSRHIIKNKRQIKCNMCGLEANRDAVGAVNIGFAYQSGQSTSNPELHRGIINRAVASPLLLNRYVGK